MIKIDMIKKKIIEESGLLKKFQREKTILQRYQPLKSDIFGYLIFQQIMIQKKSHRKREIITETKQENSITKQEHRKKKHRRKPNV